MENPLNNPPPDYEKIKARALRLLSESKPEHALMMVRDLEALADNDACLFETIGTKCYPGWEPGHFQMLIKEIAPRIEELRKIFAQEQDEIRTREAMDRALFEKYSPQILNAFLTCKTAEEIKIFFCTIVQNLQQEGEKDSENKAKQFIISCFSQQWNEDAVRRGWIQALPDLRNIRGKNGRTVRVFWKEDIPDVMDEILRTQVGRDLLAVHRAEMQGVMDALSDNPAKN